MGDFRIGTGRQIDLEGDPLAVLIPKLLAVRADAEEPAEGAGLCECAIALFRTCASCRSRVFSGVASAT